MCKINKIAYIYFISDISIMVDYSVKRDMYGYGGMSTRYVAWEPGGGGRQHDNHVRERLFKCIMIIYNLGCSQK